jgi:hypothetical protein
MHRLQHQLAARTRVDGAAAALAYAASVSKGNAMKAQLAARIEIKETRGIAARECAEADHASDGRCRPLANRELMRKDDL